VAPRAPTADFCPQCHQKSLTVGCLSPALSGVLQQFEIKPATKMVNFKDVKKGDYLEMAAYSLDLREKILSAWQNKEGTQRELAKRFKVSLSFLRDFLRRYRETAQIAARAQGGDRRSKLKGKEEELLKIIVTEKSDIYLREIQEEIKERQGIEVSISSLSRTLNRC